MRKINIISIILSMMTFIVEKIVFFIIRYILIVQIELVGNEDMTKTTHDKSNLYIKSSDDY